MSAHRLFTARFPVGFSIGSLLLSLYSVFPSISVAGEKSKSPDQHIARPSFFTVFSETGNEKFTATCKKKAEDIVTCDFIGASVNPPAKDGETGKLVRELDEGPSEKRNNTLREIEQDKVKWSNDPTHEEFLRLLQEQLNNPGTPPKTKAYLAETLAALRKGDVTNWLRAEAAKEARTCKLLAQEFSLDFKRIGPRKWLSDIGPSGICNLVKIYEVEREVNTDLWTMKETRIGAGRDDGICKSMAEDTGKVRIWTWRNPHGYELQCDFLEFY